MLGDGIRRNIATVSQEERDLFIAAVKQLNQMFYSPGGSRDEFPAGRVSVWFKQDEIHQSTHVHGCPQFLPWHREMCNRFEALLRSVNPQLSLHYWDWNLDPSHMSDGEGGFINLFGPDFMGNALGSVNGGAVGDPLLAAGFYKPDDPTDPNNDHYRGPTANPIDPTSLSYPAHGNPADPPRFLTRAIQPGPPPVGQTLLDPFSGDWTPVAPPGTGNSARWATDAEFIIAPSWEAFNELVQGIELPTGTTNNAAHGLAHSWIGGLTGTLTDPHTSFRDPFVYLLHANLDRLWAMWQRHDGVVRLDPAHVYGTQGSTLGSGNVETENAQWGILSPLEPWAGAAAQTAMTGIISNVVPVRPWEPTHENEQSLPGNNKTALDLSVVIPPSYDTAPHSSYVIVNQETFSRSQATVSLTFANAFYVVYDGFQPREIGTPTASHPTIAFAIGGSSIATMTAANPRVFLEDPAGAQDMPQRVSIAYDIVFTDMSAFPMSAGAETAVTMQVTLDYTVGGTTLAATDHTSAPLLLVSDPSPFMVDVDPNVPPPGPSNPYWLSADTRVFRRNQGDSLAGVPQGADPFAFITGVVQAMNGLPDDNNHPFLTDLPADENASQLELSPTIGTTPVFNYAIAKIRCPGNAAANGVSVFFRAFKTMVSALDYDSTSSGPVAGNYRRSGNTPGSVPLLGIQSNEIASIPFFAAPRVADMTAQVDHPINTVDFTPTVRVLYCGVWLDINDTTHPRFPLNPLADPAHVNGPFSGPLLTIQQLVTGLHYCLVTEIFFWPSGTVSDPIPANATPASSDRLAQRNLSLDSSGNPGWPSTHTVQHTFMLKPSTAAFNEQATFSPKEGPFVGADELIVQWGNVPRATEATMFFPEVKADEILALSALRQHPPVLTKLDDHTISVRVADVSYVPVPVRGSGNLAGLLTLTLPDGIRVGQAFKMSVQQCSGVSNRQRVRKMLGAFEFNIAVKTDPEMLPNALRTLSILRFIHQSIPRSNRWHPIFVRWLDTLAAKVTGLGGDPTKAQPSSTGGDTRSTKPSRRWCLKIPWFGRSIEFELRIGRDRD